MNRDRGGRHSERGRGGVTQPQVGRATSSAAASRRQEQEALGTILAESQRAQAERRAPGAILAAPEPKHARRPSSTDGPPPPLSVGDGDERGRMAGSYSMPALGQQDSGGASQAAGLGSVHMDSLDRFQMRMAEVQERVNSYARKEEVERHRLGEIRRRERETRERIDELRRFKAKRGGIDAARIHFQQMAKQVRIHEQRVKALNVRQSELEKSNQDKKEKIGLMRLEGQRMFEHYIKLKRRFERAQVAMAEKLAASKQMAQDTQEAEGRLKEVAAEVEESRREDEDEKRELDTKMAAERAQEDKGARVAREKSLQKQVASVAGDGAQEESKIVQRVKFMEAEAKERERHIKEWTEKVQEFEAAFQALKDATGINDLDKLVDTFIRNEQEVFRLYNYVQRTDAEGKGVQEEVARLREEIAEYRSNREQAAEQNLKVVRMLEEKAAELQSASADYAERTERNAASLSQLCDTVHRMFGTLDCDHYSGALRSVLKADAKQEEARLAEAGNMQDGTGRADERVEGGGYGGAGDADTDESGEALGLPRESVTESTIMQVMGVVEQAAYDTLHRYALFVANKSPSEALPAPTVPPNYDGRRVRGAVAIDPPGAPAVRLRPRVGPPGATPAMARKSGPLRTPGHETGAGHAAERTPAQEEAPESRRRQPSPTGSASEGRPTHRARLGTWDEGKSFGDDEDEEDLDEEEEEEEGDLDPSKPWSREDMLRQVALQFGPILPPGQDSHQAPSVSVSSDEEGVSRRYGK